MGLIEQQVIDDLAMNIDLISRNLPGNIVPNLYFINAALAQIEVIIFCYGEPYLTQALPTIRRFADLTGSGSNLNG